MSRILSWLLVVCGWVAFVACGNGAASETTTSIAGSEAGERADSTQYVHYPSLPIERMQELFNSVDYIDFVFYYTNFSMNQSENASIKATLAQVSEETPDVDPACQPIGSLFFQSQGRELMQAELFFSGKCVYYIWLENGRRTYANKMTANGFEFYRKVFAQAGTAN